MVVNQKTESLPAGQNSTHLLTVDNFLSYAIGTCIGCRLATPDGHNILLDV